MAGVTVPAPRRFAIAGTATTFAVSNGKERRRAGDG
jgi:hypothetical protein